MRLRINCGAGLDEVFDKVQEELVDAEIVAEFGVEGRGQNVALADEDGEVFAGGEDFDLGTCARDAGCADEDHLELRAGERGGLGEDGGVDLAAVGVALDGDV